MRVEQLKSLASKAFLLMGILLTCYVGYALTGRISSASVHYATFVLGSIIMTTLLAWQRLLDAWPDKGRNSRAIGAATTALASITAIPGAAYIWMEAEALEMAAPFFSGMEVLFGMTALFGIMLLTLLFWGWLITSVVSISIAYFFFGNHLPGVLNIPRYDVGFVMNYMGLGMNDGIFWFSRLSADYIFFLVLYAAVLLGVGMLTMVLELGKAAGRHVPGGAAFPAIIGSGIVASVMGQALSNVMLTGRLTIPMMKSHGYRKEMAGAVEAIASTAGQLMPPVLGLAGFIIAEFLGVPYVEIALAALVPGLLFLSGVTIAVLIAGHRERLPRIATDVDGEAIMRLLPPFLISFGGVLVALLWYYSPGYAGLLGVVIALLLAPMQGRFRPSLKEIRKAYVDGLEIVTVLTLLLIAVGPLAQTFLSTNLMGNISIVLSTMLPDNVIILLIGAMVAALVVGMGLPMPVCYIVVAIMLVPFLQQLGVAPLAAHFFVFYFGVFSAISPPVAVAPLAASIISGGSFLGTAIDALKIGATTLIIPFGFVYHPELLQFPHLSWGMGFAVVWMLCIQAMMSFCMFGYLFRDLRFLERTMFGVFALLGFASTLFGSVLILIATTICASIFALWIYWSRDVYMSRYMKSDIQPIDAAVQ